MAQKEKKRHILKGDKIISSVLESKYDYLTKKWFQFQASRIHVLNASFPFRVL